MIRKLHIVISFGFLLLVPLACNLIPTQPRTFENERISFTIPAGWQTMEEVWDRPATRDRDYYGLGLQELVMIQYPPEQGQGKAFFAVASSPLAEGEQLEARFTQAYQNAIPEIEDVIQGTFELGGLTGFEITYRRPWGEPWWNFRDIWLEQDGMIYVLSFHASPNAFETYSETLDGILESFQVNE